MSFDLSVIKYDDKGLVPAIIQEYRTKKVLMLAYMNQESLQKTLETGKTWFWSRSRQQFWNKGETSGHFQLVKSISYDCDADTLLVQVEQIGVACHTGANSCFFNEIPFSESKQQTNEQPKIQGNQQKTETNSDKSEFSTLIAELYQLIMERKVERPEGSYTTYLFEKGQDKILKKVGEESAEVIIASKSDNKQEVVYEVGDLIYHLLVLLNYHDITLEEVYEELNKRR